MIDKVQILRKMSGLQRLEQAFKMSDFTLELAKKNILKNLEKKLPQKE